MVFGLAAAVVCGASANRTATMVPKAATPLPLPLMSFNITALSAAVKAMQYATAPCSRQATT